MHRFKSELDEGQIHLRDRLQFELKSDFSPQPMKRRNIFTQEFYIFVPNALQINRNTYSKEQFYHDCTNFIRYKTPRFQLKALISFNNPRSPLTRLKALSSTSLTPKDIATIEDELKLFGNIVRSAVRKKTRKLVNRLLSPEMLQLSQTFNDEVFSFINDLQQLREAFSSLQEDFSQHFSIDTIKQHFLYVNTFINNAIDYHLTGLLYMLHQGRFNKSTSLEKALKNMISPQPTPLLQKTQKKMTDSSLANEYFLYQRGLLNKFVMDALLLNVSRTASQQRYFPIIGALAAGIAMLLYLLVFIWQGTIFVINSTPFVVIMVITYIIKDRIKEGLRSLYHREASRWLSDFITEIRTPDGEKSIGKLKEIFSFVDEEKLPAEIIAVRNKEFHTILETFKRPETVIYYKKEVNLKGTTRPVGARRHQLNNIFRFNIHRFLEKASDPYHKYLAIDPSNDELQEKQLPKVYHVNVIMRNSYVESDGATKIELQKFRLIIDKEGIKRIEQVNPPTQNL